MVSWMTALQLLKIECKNLVFREYSFHGLCDKSIIARYCSPQQYNGLDAHPCKKPDLQHPCIASRDPEAKANRIAPQRCQDPLVASPSLRVKFMAAGALLFSSVSSMGYVLRNCGTSGLRTGQVGQNSANAGLLCS